GPRHTGGGPLARGGRPPATFVTLPTAARDRNLPDAPHPGPGARRPIPVRSLTPSPRPSNKKSESSDGSVAAGAPGVGARLLKKAWPTDQEPRAKEETSRCHRPLALGHRPSVQWAGLGSVVQRPWSGPLCGPIF